jgi:hypothetical protein
LKRKKARAKNSLPRLRKEKLYWAHVKINSILYRLTISRKRMSQSDLERAMRTSELPSSISGVILMASIETLKTMRKRKSKRIRSIKGFLKI